MTVELKKKLSRHVEINNNYSTVHDAGHSSYVGQWTLLIWRGEEQSRLARLDHWPVVDKDHRIVNFKNFKKTVSEEHACMKQFKR